MLCMPDLSAGQQKRLADLRERNQRAAVERRAELRLATMDLRRLMRDGSADQAEIDAQIDRIAGMRAELRKARAATMLEMRSVLTPEQLERWRSDRMGMWDGEVGPE
jgi:Spy/CpxP family protein refolding chaperone